MYKIGQFRKTQTDSYLVQLTTTLNQQQTPNKIHGDIHFYNIYGILTGDNIVNNQNSYYLRFSVKQRVDSEQKFNLKLVNTMEIEDNEQLIQEFVVPMGTSISYFQIVFTPNSTYNQILWELQRTILDYQISYANMGKAGRLMDITVNNFSRLINIFSLLKNSYSDMQYLTKIGIQGPPSMLMCINGEQIRIGKSGIYEINNDIIKITFIGFVPKQSINNNYFIMDFEY